MEIANRLFSTRGGTLLLAGIAALLAAVLVLVYVNHYRSTVKAGGVEANVLVALNRIPKGTPGNVVAQEHLFQATKIRLSQLQSGALSDPGSLAGRVASTDIFPGQQLTANDFSKATATVASNLIGAQRAITLPIDTPHGLAGTIHAGDTVDVYGGFNVIPIDKTGQPTGGQQRPVLRLLVADLPVIAISGTKSNSGLGNSASPSITLKATSLQAANLAFASDNGKLWYVLRPPSGATAPSPNIVTLETELLGLSPIAALQSFGATR
jgi:pilus assembly protein CpaB